MDLVCSWGFSFSFLFLAATKAFGYFWVRDNWGVGDVRVLSN